MMSSVRMVQPLETKWRQNQQQRHLSHGGAITGAAAGKVINIQLEKIT
jgi:hypothetical protein